MKKILLAALVAATSMNVMADDYNYLTVKTNSAEQSIELAAIKKITFEGTNVIVYTSEGQETFPQSEMEKMYFSSAATAVESLATESESMKLEGGQLKVNGNGLLHIYSSNGTLQRMAKVTGATTISLSNLPKGIYIINLGNQTIKVTK